MKNLKISLKLILSFAIVIVLAIAVGVFGIIGMDKITKADTVLYEYNVIAVAEMGNIRTNLQEQRASLRNMVLHAGNSDNQKVQESINDMRRLESEMIPYMELYESTITDESLEKKYYDAKNVYLKDYAAIKNDVIANCQISFQAGYDVLYEPTLAELVEVMTSNFFDSSANNEVWAKEQSDANDALAMQMTYIEIGVLIVAVIVALSLAVYISRLLSKPMGILTEFMNKAGGQGDISLSPEDERIIGECATVKDEIGQCISSTAKFIKRLNAVGEVMNFVANGDLTHEITMLSDKDAMGLALTKMMDSLNDMFSEIHTAAAQVNVGSTQVADGAQALAQGSTEQASAVEELSSSISEIAQKTRDSSDMANRAAGLATEIKQNAERGNRQMDQMMEAVKEINQANQKISNVIKVIDDIAFQTNILALNAAVEAARVGQHGKGFAVVAEEVRNLSAKSAEAAKDTSNLIENSMTKAEMGVQIASETAASLAEIVEGINESTRLVGDIAKSSEEQSVAIDQVNKGIDQVAQVVQQNSATAEQSAAASEEMSGQSTMLDELISQFKIKNAAQNTRNLGGGNKNQYAAIPEKSGTVPSSSQGGKY